MTLTPLAVAGEANCELGENPLWNADERCVYWTDIPAGKIFRLDIATRKVVVAYAGESVGGFTIQENGGLLLFRANNIARLSRDGKISIVRTFSDEGMVRFNDVIADPEGRVFAGTVGTTTENGGLYRVDLDGSITKLFGGTRCSNGMGFSPDQKKFYWTNTTTRQIFRFDYDPLSGELSNRQLFFQTAGDAEGLPDGLAVDAEGFVWSARWGGSCIKRHTIDGNIFETMHFPVKNITSMCFGGENLDELFVTSAHAPDEKRPMAGALFSAKVRVRGLLEFRSRI